MRRLRRTHALAVSTVLVASLIQVVTSPVAVAAGGPSIPLPGTPSTPVTPPTLQPYSGDQASLNELHHDQKPKNVTPDGRGTTSATSLAPSASWTVAPHTGDFSWSYPLRVPPAPGGLVPSLALSYRSSAVDGRTSATNNQASWVGEGWDLSPGFVERTYGSCADDSMGPVKPPETKGDLCWRSENATATYDGHGGSLIRDDSSKQWRTKSDDGSRIERFENDKGVANGDNNGEHWRITSVDGTQYWFGSQSDAKSTWTVPVYGDDPDEPCKGATLEASHCVQAYRWNLDRVVDRNGNEIRYHYLTETNKYGMNEKDAAVEYVRGGTLDRVDYGMGAGVTEPSGRVTFALADRCVRDSTCTQDKKDNWPDVAWESNCTATPCKEHAPSFWSTKRLSSVTTQVRRAGGFDDVDRWDLDQQFPDPGDAEKASLWLKGVKHTGLVGDGSATQPSVTFEGTALPNRVDTAADGVAPLYRYRVTGIRSESGGLISVTYSSQCKPTGPLPDKTKLEDNELWCFPVKWAIKNHEQRTDFFHKYLVTKVVTSDRLRVQNNQELSSPEQVVGYEYLDGAGWRWDDSEFTKDDRRTYNEFRGFARVRVRTGTDNDPSGRTTMSEQRFHQGMDGNRLPNGTRPAELEDSRGGKHKDSDWLQGFGYETSTFAAQGPSDKPDPPRLTTSVSEPYVDGPTATRDKYKAYIVKNGLTKTYTALADGTWRTAQTKTSYDKRGLPWEVDDRGDLATAADDRCTTTVYTPKESKWLMNLVGTAETVSVDCDQQSVFPRDAIVATRNTFDDNGNTKKVEVAKERPAGGPDYTIASTMDYDAHGRAVATTDALNRTSRTAYTPQVGGPVTEILTTTPEPREKAGGLTSRNAIEPAWGVPVRITDPNDRVTTITYDPAGRKTKVWLPNQPTTSKPNYRFDYQIRNDAANAVSTTRLGPNGTEITNITLYDGLLRPRQTQTPAFGGGRLIVDTRYDSQGRQWKATQPYFNDGAVDTTLWLASDTEIPGHTRTYYDDAGRPSAEAYYSGAHEKWRTTTTYGGDRVSTTPPLGGTAVTTINDGRGRVVEQRRYRAPKPEGDYDATRYTYTKSGEQESITDPADKVWRFTYDLRGRMRTNVDPDGGTSTLTYDDANQLTSIRDAGGGTVAYSYDGLGRKTSTFADRVGGTKLAEWTYDTVAKGKGYLASSTRYVGTDAYTRKVLSYNQFYQATGTMLSIPAAEGLLAGNYDSYSGYNPDGTISSQSYAKAGELPAETVSYRYHDVGPMNRSWGGYDGKTFEHVTATEYTRYGEIARLHQGTGDKRVWQSFYYETDTRRLSRTVVDAELTSPMVADTNYTYDPAGTVTSIADVPQAQPPTVDVQCFRHDYLRRTTEAWTPAVSTWKPNEGCKADPAVNGLAGPAPYWHSYTYDKAGNRKVETQHAAGGDTTKSYNYDVPDHAHALSSVTTNGPGVDKSEEYKYSLTGAVTRKGNQEFTWDIEGKLGKITQDGKSTSFVYDADGNRLIRREPDNTTVYLDGQELRLNLSGGNPTVTRYYTHAGKGIAMRTGKGQLTWLAGDHQNTEQISIGSAELDVTRRRQLPFGEARGTATAWPNDHGFVGGTQDKSTGLTNLGARQYDPSTGRFMSVDPILNPADAQQMNGYTYSNNNPTTFSDPSGAYCDMCDYYHHTKGETSVWAAGPPNRLSPIGPRMEQKRYEIATGQNKDWRIQPIIFDRRAPTFDELKGRLPGGASYRPGEYQEALSDWAKGICQRPTPNDRSFCSFADMNGMLELDNPEFGQMLFELSPLGVISSIDGCVNGEESCLWILADLPLGKIGKIGKIGKAGKALDEGGEAAGDVTRWFCSFTGDTHVVMADGTTKPIAEVKVGEEVLAADPQSGTSAPRTVTAVWSHHDVVVDLTTQDGAKVATTEDHPFWNATDRQWQRADELDAGDSLTTASGDQVHVSGLREETARWATAHNMTVAGLHTYFVLVAGKPVLVHNACGPEVGGGASLGNITAAEARRIQNAADKIGRPITLVGSRAGGNVHAESDWDYIIEGMNNKTKKKVGNSLPLGPIELGVGRRIDFLNTTLDKSRPYITFHPRNQ
nr:RHS repeat-associated core domain-containing protein [Kibdelosporangium sp. MJ126-NF4]